MANLAMARPAKLAALPPPYHHWVENNV